MFGGCIHNQVYLWKRKINFWRGLVEVDEINKYSPFSPLLGGDYNVGEPIWIVSFPDDFGLDELSYFTLYDFQAFWKTGGWSGSVNSL